MVPGGQYAEMSLTPLRLQLLVTLWVDSMEVVIFTFTLYTIIFQEKECQTFCFFPQPQFTEDALLLVLFLFVHVLASQILTSGYTAGDGPIFLSQLLCSGSEQSLLECSSGYPVGLHRCDHSMDVGLHCLGIC